MFFKNLMWLFFYVLVLGILIYGICVGDYNMTFLSFLTILIYIGIEFLERFGKLEIFWLLKFLVFLFVFSAVILGEVFNFYSLIPIWDNLLHFTFGILSACFGFSMIKSFQKLYDNFKSLPIVCLVIVVCFSVTIGVIWEFFEYRMDRSFRFDMQKDTLIEDFSSVSFSMNENRVLYLDEILYTEIVFNGGRLKIDNGHLDIGLIDTIFDMKVNMIGALVFGVLCSFYMAFPEKFGWVRFFTINFKK